MLIDVSGWFGPLSQYTSMNLSTVTPSRLVDTRIGPGAPARRLAAGETIAVWSTTPGLVANVTAVEPAGAGFLTVYPCGFPRPDSSTLNPAYGLNVANPLIAFANASGVCIYTSVSTHLLVDRQAVYA